MEFNFCVELVISFKLLLYLSVTHEYFNLKGVSWLYSNLNCPIEIVRELALVYWPNEYCLLTMDGLSLEESLKDIDANLFRQFREKTKDIGCDELKMDNYVGRWLKARSWDVDKAEKMFRAHYQWSREVKVNIARVVG